MNRTLLSDTDPADRPLRTGRKRRREEPVRADFPCFEGSQCAQWLLVITVIFCFAGIAHAQSRQKFEPADGRILHGLGQYVGGDYSDSENWAQVLEYLNTVDSIPVMYSAYMFIDPLLDSLAFSIDLADITTNHGYPFIMTLGLILLDSATVFGGYPSIINIEEERILNGEFDAHLIDIATEIQSVGMPCFLRPGFEFGTNNAGIHNDPSLTSAEFIAVWQHIRQVFDAVGVTNLAWIWNTVNPDDFSFMDYYPGDGLVDWFGINWFTDGQINGSQAFLDSALAHHKPVIVCEAAPIENNGTLNSGNWNSYFVPFFQAMDANQHIKAFIYIHDPWDRGAFAHWPDTRINQDPTGTIATNYRTEMGDPRYIHMNEYLQAGIFDDGGLPIQLMSFSATLQRDRVVLRWETASELANLGFYVDRARSGENPPRQALQFQRLTPELIDGAINSNVRRTYTVEDTAIRPGYFHHCRLWDVDLTGQTVDHPVETVFVQGSPPHSFTLDQNAPNPFNSQTQITFILPRAQRASLDIVNLLGQPVATLTEGWRREGRHRVAWDGLLRTGRAAPSGLYFYTLQTEDTRATGKMILLR